MVVVGGSKPLPNTATQWELSESVSCYLEANMPWRLNGFFRNVLDNAKVGRPLLMLKKK